jgi:hypothetical protein
MIMGIESNGYGVKEKGLWCPRVTVMVLESNQAICSSINHLRS